MRWIIRSRWFADSKVNRLRVYSASLNGAEVYKNLDILLDEYLGVDPRLHRAADAAGEPQER